MRDRSVLVTGASRGIGAATAGALAALGARLVVTGRDEGRLRQVAERYGCGRVSADLTTPEGRAQLVEGVRTQLGGGPDAVVSSAGAFHISPAADMPEAELEQMLTLNLQAPFDLVRAFLPEMRERRQGHFIQIGSVAGRRAFPGNAGYSASKFGLRGLHEVLVEELKGSGVRSTLIEPGAVDTALWDPFSPDTDPHLPARSQMLQPSDVAEAVVFALTRPATVHIPLIQIQRA